MSDCPTVCRRLASARSLLCLSHVNPDGDALGSMLALAQAARAAGKNASCMIDDDIPQRYRYLIQPDELTYAGAFDTLAGHSDTVVILDTCSRSQLGSLADRLPELHNKTVVLDHHATTDDIAETMWIDTSAAATGLMVFETLQELGWPMDERVCYALAAAIYTDTGWLRFSNTDARACRAIADLIERGVEPDRLYEQIYQTDRPQRLALLQRVLASLELHAQNQLAVMTVSLNDFEQTGARPDETENLINEALRIGSVEVAILLTEQPTRPGEEGPRVRVSLRSRREVDVSKIAASFGGGGHARAAGLKSPLELDDIKSQLIQAIRNILPPE